MQAQTQAQASNGGPAPKAGKKASGKHSKTGVSLKKAPQARRVEAAVPLEDRKLGFTIQIRAVSGDTWRLEGNSKHHLVSEVKERLVAQDPRFRNHRADLVLGSRVLGDAETLEQCGVEAGARLAAVFSDLRAAVLVIGGGTAGRVVVKELSPAFPEKWIILVDPQEFFEHPCGILRAYADPVSWESLVVPFEDLVKRYPNVIFVQGEVHKLRPGAEMCSAAVVSALDGSEFNVRFEYCVVAAGRSFGSSATASESLWKPTSLSAARRVSNWPALDERTVAGRRRHILEEHRRLSDIGRLSSGRNVLVVGAGYQGVEWACDLRHYFPGLKVVLIDEYTRCLHMLPVSAAEYAQNYMDAHGIETFYEKAYDPKRMSFWTEIGLQRRADFVYVLNGISAHNGFMPPSTTSGKGPGGGGWVVTNSQLQVCLRNAKDQPIQPWASGRVFAAGDCHYGAVVAGERPGQRDAGFAVPPVVKTQLAAACWASLACRNIVASSSGWPMEASGWPLEAGIIAVSLGPNDGVVAWKVRHTQDSGESVLFGEPAVEMKRRLTWPADPEWLIDPTKWLATFQEGIPAGRLFSERSRAALGVPGRAW